MESIPPLAVEAFAYPGAAQVLADQGIALKTGDGNIRLADCASESGLVQVARRVGAPACFKITGPSGYLAVEIPRVYNIKGDNHTLKATLNTAGTVSSVDIAKNLWTEVGEGDAHTSQSETTVLELSAGGGPARPTATSDFPAVGTLNVGAAGRAGSRACTATLVDPLWALAAAGCFADKPTSVTAGAPSVKSTFTVGGRTVDIAELVPRSDRDALLVRLGAPVTGVVPLKVATSAPVSGEKLRVAGTGRTGADWISAKPHAAVHTVGTITGTGIDSAPASGSGAICAGDTGAPLLRDANGTTEIAGLASLSWQGGCLATPTTETRTGARNTRTDDLGQWIGTQTGRTFDIVNPTSGRCLNLAGPGPWNNGNGVILFDCTL
ncbi:trypsin-like serine protease, partial [Streptomyces goshikiensis]